jgi:uncharacterized caspase-like protein
MRALFFMILILCLVLLPGREAFADKRVALVIGNSVYQNVARLANPANDSAAMSDALRSAGFDTVELRRDLSATLMRRAIRDFSDAARDADVAIIYFAGHGIEIDGANYLIPVDAVLERDIDAFDEAIPLDRLLSVIEPAKKLRLVILDACRDNPFAKSMRRTVASRGVGRGLARIEPGGSNTLVAFSARAGSTAADGDGNNSPFTAALVKYLTKPGLDIRRAFGFARDEVLKVTNNRQEPFIYGSLGGDDFPLVAARPAPDPNQGVRQDYELAERIGTREAWDSFLSVYSEGFYAKLAQAQRNKLAAGEARLAAIEKARLAEEESERLTNERAKERGKASAQDRAAADAKAAEGARLAAEKNKALEDEKLAEAERVRTKAAEQARLATERKKEQEMAGAAAAERVRQVQQAKVAEEARVAAENARAAAEAKATSQRLAEESARVLAESRAAEVARAKAEAEQKAAEKARVVAAKAKAAEEARAAAAQAKAAEEARAAATQAEAAEQARIAVAQAKAAEDARVAAAQAAADEAAKSDARPAIPTEQARRTDVETVAGATSQNAEQAKVGADERPIGALAALTPPGGLVAATRPDENVVRSLQNELRRIGCGSGPVSEIWDSQAERALHLFNKNAGTKFDTHAASVDALDTVRGKSGRICPLICGHGLRPDGDRCARIVCKDGYEPNDDNVCERTARVKPRREKPASLANTERSVSPAQERQPAPVEGAPSAKRMGELYAQCRSQMMAAGVGGHRRGPNFFRVDACARNGGRL